MVKLKPNMLIKTNYSGPYRIQSVLRGCASPTHLNCIICTNPDGKGKYWLHNWDEETLLSLVKTYCGHKTEPDYDRIIILENDRPVQGTLF
jgi:hypothetical protein